MSTTATTQDAELDHYKRLPIGRLVVQLGAATKNEKPKPTRGGDIDAENFQLNGWKFQCFQVPSGHFMFKSHDGSLSVRGRNTGTIVDILVLLEGSLGKARQRLRGLTGYSPSSTSSTTPVQQETTPATAPAIPLSSRPPVSPPSQPAPAADPLPTPAELEAIYDERGPIWRMIDPVPHYLRSRYLGALHPVFHWTFRTSKSGNGSAFFPYFRKEDGVWHFAGTEQKSHGYKSYDKGGRAGIWTAAFDHPRAVVVTESPIDAMSYARLMTDYSDLSIGFLSVRSGGEKDAVEYLSELIETKGLRIVILATDNDSAGMLYASKIMAGLHKYSADISMRYEAPIHGQSDWNDALKADLIAKRSRNSGSGGPRPDEIEAEKIAVTVDQEAEKSDENPKSPAEYDPRDGIEFN